MTPDRPVHRPYRLALALWLFGCVLAFAARPGWSHGVNLELHHPLPPDSVFHTRFAQAWAEKVERESGGRLHVHVHAAASSDGLYEQVADGSIDAAWLPLQSSPEKFSGLAPFEFPFLLRRAETASRALAEYLRLNDLRERDFDGVRLLAAHVDDGAQLHWRERGQAASDGPGGARIGVLGPFAAGLAKAAGAQPVELRGSEAAAALADGRVDAVLVSWQRAGEMGVDRSAHVHTEFGPDRTGLMSSVYAFVLNPGTWRGLPDDLRAVIEANSGPETAAWLGRVFDEAAAAARAAAVARGDVVSVMAPENAEPWRTAARASIEERVKAYERAGARLRPLVDSAREQVQAFDRKN